MSGIYIHIPFCERKCFYCDFYSVDSLELRNSFVKALSKELHLRSIVSNPEAIETIYFGGGTPSVLNSESIDGILNKISKYYPVSLDCETTIECNPNSLTKEKLNDYKSFGINRISLGVQSLIDTELLFLQRLHNADQARKSINNIHTAGFSNISLDLIYAIPGSSLESLEHNLSEFTKLKPNHISAYSLIYEEGTALSNALAEGSVHKIDETIEADMYSFVMQYLQQNGYNHYEVSNYAVNGYESRHNSNYWNHTDYFGFGPSAHSYLNERRSHNYSDIKKYIFSLASNQLPVESEEVITDELFFEEMVFLGLRSSGINLSKLNQQFNIDFLRKKENIIIPLITEGYMAKSGDYLSLTDKGFLVCDEICRKLI